MGGYNDKHLTGSVCGEGYVRSAEYQEFFQGRGRQQGSD
jgi:hypothetical protein